MSNNNITQKKKKITDAKKNTQVQLEDEEYKVKLSKKIKETEPQPYV